ncbi:MAG: DUF7557 family protein [Halobacteriota archaeon]
MKKTFNMRKTKTIHVSEETKKRLDEIKIHRKEPYEDVVRRLLDDFRGGS